MSRQVLDVLWSEWLWLPPNITWMDITNGPDMKFVYTEVRDLWYQIPFTICILALRIVLTKNIFIPFGKLLGVPEKKIRIIQANALLESAYKSSNVVRQNASTLAKKLDITERQVERWFRLRRNQNKPSKIVKFCETSWKTTFLFASSAFGFYLVLGKDWFWNIEKIVHDFPHLSLTQGEWWYYMLNTSFYWSLLITQFTDVRHKDFWPMFVHHIVAIFLLIASWNLNVYKFGMMILPLQDSSEMFLQLTKTIHYANLPVTSYFSFFIFLAWWIAVRLYICPVNFMWAILFSAYELYGVFPLLVISGTLLFVFMVLQLWWTWLIIIVAYNALATKSCRDVRSSESEITDTDQDDDKIE